MTFLNLGGASSYLALEIAKEQLVRLVNALHDVLNSLRANKVPEGALGQLLLGNMLHQSVRAHALTSQPVIAAYAERCNDSR